MAAIFDTHAHYTAAAFDADREAVLSALPGKNVALVVDCGTDLESSLASLALGERYPFLHTAAGIHPESLIEEDASTRRRFGGDWRHGQRARQHRGRQPGREYAQGRRRDGRALRQRRERPS